VQKREGLVYFIFILMDYILHWEKHTWQIIKKTNFRWFNEKSKIWRQLAWVCYRWETIFEQQKQENIWGKYKSNFTSVIKWSRSFTTVRKLLLLIATWKYKFNKLNEHKVCKVIAWTCCNCWQRFESTTKPSGASKSLMGLPFTYRTSSWQTSTSGNYNLSQILTCINHWKWFYRFAKALKTKQDLIA